MCKPSYDSTIRKKVFLYIKKNLRLMRGERYECVNSIADDLTQNTLIKAFVYFNQHDNSKSLDAWIKAIAYREILQHIRSKKSGRNLRNAYRECGYGSNFVDCFNQVLLTETLLIIQSLVEKNILTAQAQDLLIALAKGQTAAEIAEATGQVRTTLNSTICRSRKILTKCL